MSDTPRLPQVGADDNDWGNVLNTYLAVSHKEDGTLKNIPVQTLVFANPLAIDGITYKDWKCASMTGSSVINLTNVSDGEAGMIEIIIDNVGGYTVTLGAMFTKNSGGGAIVTTANVDNIIAWTKSGTDIIYSISQIA